MSLQAAARIMSHPETQLDALEEISQNFPSHARSLSSVSVSKDLKKEVKKNRDYFTNAMGIGPKDSMLYVNGLSYDLDYVDVFSLFDTLRSEAKSLDGLGRLGLTDKQVGPAWFLFFEVIVIINYGLIASHVHLITAFLPGWRSHIS